MQISIFAYVISQKKKTKKTDNFYFKHHYPSGTGSLSVSEASGWKNDKKLHV